MGIAMPAEAGFGSLAVLAVTQSGVHLAFRLRQQWQDAAVYVPDRHRFALALGATGFKRLRTVFPEVWRRHPAIVCIMATGIVVRLCAPLLEGKREDPAVVVVDERGRFVISLLSGHLGGANRLTRQVAKRIGGQAVITTASDVQGKPALDLLAQQLLLTPENPEQFARLERAVLEDEPFWVYDPRGGLKPALAALAKVVWLDRLPEVNFATAGLDEASPGTGAGMGERPDPGKREHEIDWILASRPGIWVSERVAPAGLRCLILRPSNLVIGIGCNRNTPAEEILELISDVLQDGNLSELSVRNLASVDLKADEPGLLMAAARMNRPVRFFAKREIEAVQVPNPSEMVQKHVGVRSVCEAAALASARSARLLIPKTKTKNVTVAVALADWTSSAWDRVSGTT